MKKVSQAIIMITICFLVISGCGKEEVAPEPETEVPTVEIEPEPQNIQPLTGVKTDEDISTFRPFAVIINNDPAARPQSGLYMADVVYELLVEGSITRFVAVYHSQQPEWIGPVRSAREYHIDLSNGYNALFVAHGWSPEAKRLLEQERKAEFINGMYLDGTIFQRSSDRKAPHNSYVSFSSMQKGLEDKGYILEGDFEPLLFHESVEKMEGTNASTVSINYSSNNVTFQYNQEEQIYHRFNGTTQTMDKETETPVAVSNVFILETRHEVIDEQGRRDIDLTTGGKGLLIQQGVVKEVEWVNDNGRLLPAENGQILPFLPGQTWINIVPSLQGDVVIE
ncbi:DUF3048 domain-containing protein [Alkalihalobacillus sp. LMS39]|uniref:DUF3048 domain-containing protein n=1 Tax=Alkalihalobacillus sp. LMS39 TaxID=2924032 RepID=UPI001FB2E3E5|nr:DUF3048 domain-containing protein [Alkalihalobacillus sp. LMS39]UOE94488.1 DUF3048 domain-containing protein [Alkalihalobacillus sp. LMS39]